jgi:hypothetical protein
MGTTPIQLNGFATRTADAIVEWVYGDEAASATPVQEREDEAWFFVTVNGQRFRVTVHEA